MVEVDTGNICKFPFCLKERITTSSKATCLILVVSISSAERLKKRKIPMMEKINLDISTFIV
jgi:hypothetical protein